MNSRGHGAALCRKNGPEGRHVPLESSLADGRTADRDAAVRANKGLGAPYLVQDAGDRQHAREARGRTGDEREMPGLEEALGKGDWGGGGDLGQLDASRPKSRASLVGS